MIRTQAIRVTLIAVGILALLRGAWVGWTTIPSVDRVHVAIWLVLGVVLHDGVFAPVSVLLGRLALPWLPAVSRGVARAILAWTAAVLIIGLPLVYQAPRRQNPTVEPGHPIIGVYVALAVGVGVAVVVRLALAARVRLNLRS